MRSSSAQWFALIVSLAVAVLGGSKPKPETVTVAGEVLELTAALKSAGVAADPEPIARQVVLRSEKGELIPLLSDDASRALFQDERLRGRRTEVRAYRLPGIPYLQVISFKIEEKGRLRTPEYYCEICAISVRAPQICPCCQGPMELRMKPEAN